MNVLIYGAGQLARMMYLAGTPMGILVQAVDVNTQDVVNPVTKTLADVTLEQALEQADAVSVEFEHVPEALLEQAQASGKLKPGMEAILTGADRVREKRLLEKLSVANCAHRIIDDISQLAEAVTELGDKLVIKASRDGYDGYGQWRLKSVEDLPELEQTLSALDLKKVPLIVEKMAAFERELSLVGVRSADGQLGFYPLAENLHHQGQLHVSVAPAVQVSEALQQQAEQAFNLIADELEYVGVLAVEFFQCDDQLLVNEIAPRVHNSGHWSMQGADTCQFENHLRAICDLPIGDTHSLRPSAMVNIIGYDGFSRKMLAIEGCHIHWYGKTVRVKRKMGHFNLSASTRAELGQKLLTLSELLPKEHFPVLAQEGQKLSSQ